MGDPWPPDPQGDARFLAAVERMDAKLMAPDPERRWRWPAWPPRRPARRPKVRKVRKVIKPQPTRVPLRKGKHVRARHAAKTKSRWVVPMWPVLIILLVQAVALVAVLR